MLLKVPRRKANARTGKQVLNFAKLWGKQHGVKIREVLACCIFSTRTKPTSSVFLFLNIRLLNRHRVGQNKTTCHANGFAHI